MSGNVGIFADLILLALLLIGLVLGWRQGFVQALTRIIVVVAALLLASWIAGKLAEPAARWLREPDPVREAGAAADGPGQHRRRRRDAGGLRL